MKSPGGRSDLNTSVFSTDPDKNASRGLPSGAEEDNRRAEGAQRGEHEEP